MILIDCVCRYSDDDQVRVDFYQLVNDYSVKIFVELEIDYDYPIVCVRLEILFVDIDFSTVNVFVVSDYLLKYFVVASVKDCDALTEAVEKVNVVYVSRETFLCAVPEFYV
jgi:hypothetical protein